MPAPLYTTEDLRRMRHLDHLIQIGLVAAKEWYLHQLAEGHTLTRDADTFCDDVIEALPYSHSIIYDAVRSVLSNEELTAEQLMDLFNSLKRFPSVEEQYWRRFITTLPKLPSDASMITMHLYFMAMILVENHAIPPHVVHGYISALVTAVKQQSHKPYWTYVARLLTDEEINDPNLMLTAMILEETPGKNAFTEILGLHPYKVATNLMAVQVTEFLHSIFPEIKDRTGSQPAPDSADLKG